jgi:hypothetical protein
MSATGAQIEHDSARGECNTERRDICSDRWIRDQQDEPGDMTDDT